MILFEFFCGKYHRIYLFCYADIPQKSFYHPGARTHFHYLSASILEVNYEIALIEVSESGGCIAMCTRSHLSIH